MRARLALWWVAGLLVVSTGNRLAAQAADGDEALQALNQSVRSAYRDARLATLQRTAPILLAEGDRLVLLRGKERLVAPLDLKLYHRLKAVAHAPMGLYLLLNPRGDGKLSAQRLETLGKYRTALGAAEKALDQQFQGGVLERQRAILQRTIAFLDQVLMREEFKNSEVRDFSAGLAQLVRANMEQAAQSQIDAMHKQMLAWRKVLTVDEWGRLRVVVIGSPMPRKDNLTVQYLARWWSETGEGRRLIYAESLFEEERALNLLGTHILDSAIGEAFFGDPLRMERDVLSDAARDYIRGLKFE